jgi:hypothetical protein
MEEKAKSFSDIWSISDEVIQKNEQVKKEVFDMPDEDLVAANVRGYVINSVGNIVAQFGFFVETAGKERVDLRVSPDGFMAAIYNRPTNVLLGYGHPLGFAGLIDPQFSNILHLGPDQANGDEVVISIQNDEKLEQQGIVVIIKDTDVLLDILPADVREDFEQSLEDAKDPIEDLNDIETTYNSYMRHIYVVLGESKPNTNAVEVGEIEVYE